MMKEGIFAGHLSLALPPLHLASLALASLTLALLAIASLAPAPLALNPFTFALLHSPLPCSPL